MVAEATADGPARRKTSWNLRTIVEEVAGRPIAELQDPSRPVHPYLKGKGIGEPTPSAHRPEPDAEDPDGPFELLYPPLVGPIGREFHGKANEHHRETLERHRPLAGPDGKPLHPPGPSRRTEPLYLHYLLLHMDRLSDSALRYLKLAVEEEIAHRHPPPAPPRATEAAEAAPGSRPKPEAGGTPRDPTPPRSPDDPT